MNLTPFEILFLTHIISDWLFQTHWAASNKAEKFLPLFIHSFVYTLFFIPAFYYLQINMLYLLVLFGTHMFLDYRRFELWWVKNIKRTSKDEVNTFTWRVLLLVIDQVFHFLILAAVIVLN